MVLHFAGVPLYVLNPENSDAYWFRIALYDASYILFPAVIFLIYLAAQAFLWVRFVRDSFTLQQSTDETLQP